MRVIWVGSLGCKFPPSVRLQPPVAWPGLAYSLCGFLDGRRWRNVPMLSSPLIPHPLPQTFAVTLRATMKPQQMARRKKVCEGDRPPLLPQPPLFFYWAPQQSFVIVLQLETPETYFSYPLSTHIPLALTSKLQQIDSTYFIPCSCKCGGLALISHS